MDPGWAQDEAVVRDEVPLEDIERRRKFKNMKYLNFQELIAVSLGKEMRVKDEGDKEPKLNMIVKEISGSKRQVLQRTKDSVVSEEAENRRRMVMARLI